MTEGTYKYCPHKILDEGWDDFKLLVSQYLNKLNEAKDDESKEDKKPETTKPDDKEEEDKIAQTSTLIALLIKLLQKILSFLK